MKTYPKITAIALATHLLFAQTAAAGGMPVFDGVHTIQNVLTQLYNGSLNTTEFGREAQRWEKQNQHNAEQGRHMAKQLITAQKFANFKAGDLPQLKERDPSEGIDIQCPGARPGIVSGLASTFRISPHASLAEQQRAICQQVVAARNLQFNNAVRLLQRLRARGTQLQDLEQARNSVGDSPGKLEANGNDVQRFMAATGNDMNEWQTVNDAFERYIQVMNTYSAGLTRQALRGKNSVVGSAVQTQALKLALKSARK